MTDRFIILEIPGGKRMNKKIINFNIIAMFKVFLGFRMLTEKCILNSVFLIIFHILPALFIQQQIINPFVVDVFR